MTNKNYFPVILVALFCLTLCLMIFKFLLNTEVHVVDPVTKETAIKQFLGFEEFKTGEKKFPEVAFYDPNGKKVTIKDFEGRYVLLNIWATWCPACVNELPSLEKYAGIVLNSKYPLDVIAVSVDREKTIEEIAEYLVNHDIAPFALYHDRDKVMLKAYPIKGMPATVLIDPLGNIRYEFLGEADWTNFYIQKMIKEEISPLMQILNKEEK